MSKAVDCFQKNAHKVQSLASDILEDVCSRACSRPRTFALAVPSAWSVFPVFPYSLSFSSFLKEPSPDFLTQWHLRGPSPATLLHHRPLFSSSVLSPTSLYAFVAVTPPHTQCEPHEVRGPVGGLYYYASSGADSSRSLGAQ